jgi:uncharacterized repeat protein (TIGR01451 family)
MTRRWLVSCVSLLIGASFTAATVGQEPSALADKIKELRREWAAAEDAPARDSEPAPRRPAAVQQRSATKPAGQVGLPQIEPDSLLPDDLFSAPPVEFSGRSGATRAGLPRPTADTRQPAAKRQSSVGEHSMSAPVTTARRSPMQRPHVDFEPDDLSAELSGLEPGHAATTTNTESSAGAKSLAVVDDFAAGLSQGAVKTIPEKTKSTPAVSTTSRGPISLPVSRVQSQPNASQVFDRYAPSDSARGTDLVGGDSKQAAQAFQVDWPTQSNSASGAVTSLPVAPRGALTGQAAEASRDSFSEADNDSTIGPNVLVTNQAPAITSDIRGPKQIAIGREASYRVRLQNLGASAAEAVVATVRIPAWAEVVNTTATSGAVRQLAADDSAVILEWQVSRLDAQANETLSIDLIPRASRPLELGVTWTHDPVRTRTIVEVQEPKLHLEVTGPEEVLFGQSHVYRLTLSNPGTGVAENVRINLLPPGGGAETVSTFEVGNLAAGATKTAEVELTAREAGKLSVQAVAIADGDLKTEAKKELFCRKPELEVDWRGPETQYAGTAATYFFRVRNPGTAAADDVSVRVSLPEGAEFVSASDGHVLDQTKHEVAWRVGSLGPGDDCYMELRTTVNTPGENKLSITAATAAGSLTDSKFGVTKVVALADLKLDVSDPAGPVAVGDEAIYEIRVTNRGASAAADVNVVGLFSAGLEPEAIDGAPYTVSDGRVSFHTINKLPAGQNVVLEIRAKATEAGTHVFRAEVLCRDLEIKLAAEETTRFYDSHVSHELQPTSQAAMGASYEATAR